MRTKGARDLLAIYCVPLPRVHPISLEYLFLFRWWWQQASKKKGFFSTSCCFGSSCDLELLSGVMGVYVAKYMQRRRDEEEVLSSNICNMNISISVLATI